MVSKISQLSAIRKAGRWARTGAKWHFHLLSPKCLFNSSKKHELVLESGAVVYVVHSSRSMVATAKHLVQLLHGRGVTEAATSASSPKLAGILSRVKHLASKRVKWHHHLLFPKCMFNARKGKWVLAFEDPLNNQLTEIFYARYPASDLPKMERAFYSQK